MTLKRKQLFGDITAKIVYLQGLISNNGSLNLNDLSIHAENFFRDLLKLVYGWNLINTNAGNQNAADIDLVCYELKLAIQVTARNERKKISDTLDSFFEKDENKDYRLKFLLIGKEALNYRAFDKHEEKFNSKEDIIDIKGLLNKINDLKTERLVEIANFLEQELSNPAAPSSHKFYPPSFLPDLEQFVGRKEIFDGLRTTLAEHHKASIHDMSGIGKTFACYKYAFDNQHKYSRIFFVDCSKESMIESLAKLGRDLKPGIANKDREDDAREFRNWLETNNGWLVMFDNVDEPATLKPFVPVNKKGDCIFTSNVDSITEIAVSVKINKMSVEESCDLLKKRIIGPEHEKDWIKKGIQSDAAKKIVAAIDGLPLAIVTTAAFIREKKLSFDEFWEIYGKKGEVFINSKDEFNFYKRNSVSNAFSITLDEVAEIKSKKVSYTVKLQRLFIDVASFVSSENIPIAFLYICRPPTKSLSNIWNRLTKRRLRRPEITEEQYIDVLNNLTKFAIFEKRSDSQFLSMHRLIQETVRARMTEDQKFAVCNTVLSNLFSMINYYERLRDDPFADIQKNGAQLEIYYSHCIAALENAVKIGFQGKIFSLVCLKVLENRREVGNPDLTLQLAEINTKLCKKNFGKNSHEFADSLYQQATVLASRKELKRAEQLLLENIRILKKKLFGKRKYEVQLSYDFLRHLYRQQGMFDEEIKLGKAKLEEYENEKNYDGAGYVISIKQLALRHLETGRFNDALELFRKELKIRENNLCGEHDDWDHEDYFNCLNNLAVVYWHLGAYDEVQKTKNRALEIMEDTYCLDCTTASTILTLLRVSLSTDKLSGNPEKIRDSQKSIESITDLSLRKTTNPFANRLETIANTCCVLEDYADAVSYYEEALKIFEHISTDEEERIDGLKRKIENCKSKLSQS